MTDSATYTLRLSVKVLGKEPIQGLTDPQNLVAGPVNVQVKQRWPYLILTASEFASELDAEGFLARLKCGLYNMALQYNISFNRTFEQRDITRAEDPIAAARNLAKSFGLSEAEPIQPVHGLTEEEGFVVYRSGENIRFFAMGDASVHVSTGWPRVAESLIQGIMCSKVDEGLSNPPRQIAYRMDICWQRIAKRAIS